MVLEYQPAENIFIFRCSFHEKDIAKEAKFRWNPDKRIWYSASVDNAITLAAYADEETKTVIKQQSEKLVTNYEQSFAENADIEIPVPEGLNYYGFQKAGIKFAYDNPNVLIADEVGLGKTISVVGLINLLQKNNQPINNILIICPASLRLNWQKEIIKWLINQENFYLEVVGKSIEKSFINISLNRKEKNLILISNYEKLKNKNELGKVNSILEDWQQNFLWDALIIDEAHYIKARKAQRTKVIVGNKKQGLPGIKANRKILLTGTPIVNRPSELWSLIHYLAPQKYNNWWYFVNRYCGAFQTAFGIDYSGASNLEELQTDLRSSLMIRRQKKDVLKDLPDKTRQIIEIPKEEIGLTYLAQENKQLNNINGFKELYNDVRSTEDFEEIMKNKKYFAIFSEIAKIRHTTAERKVPFVVNHILEKLEETDCLICFAYHRNVIQKIKESLIEKGIKVVSFTGEDSLEQRQNAVDDFQSGKVQVFIGSIGAAAEGITLTRASVGIFAEIDFVPGKIFIQCEGRLHRLTQKNAVLIQYLLVEESIDYFIIDKMIKKQLIIENILDKRQQCLPEVN